MSTLTAGVFSARPQTGPLAWYSAQAEPAM